MFPTSKNKHSPYLSQKIFHSVHSSILGKYVVPVVYGGGNYSTITPPHSVINILDFKSPRHLAEYLKELDKDDSKYMEYFGWKKDFGVMSQYHARGQGFCKLCEVLNNPNQPRKVYNNLDTWWDKEGSCDLNMKHKLKKTYEPAA